MTLSSVVHVRHVKSKHNTPRDTQKHATVENGEFLLFMRAPPGSCLVQLVHNRTDVVAARIRMRELGMRAYAFQHFIMICFEHHFH